MAEHAGEALAREGVPSLALFVIGAGRASVRFGGAEKWQIGPPECVGEMSLIDRGPSQATVVAVEETRALAISASDFEELLATQPAVVKALLRRLARRLREVAQAAFVETSTAMDC